MADCYCIDNEAIQQRDGRPLTIANFMARFFNYSISANDNY
jgi:hypothetical protein